MITEQVRYRTPDGARVTKEPFSELTPTLLQLLSLKDHLKVFSNEYVRIILATLGHLRITLSVDQRFRFGITSDTRGEKLKRLPKLLEYAQQQGLIHTFFADDSRENLEEAAKEAGSAGVSFTGIWMDRGSVCDVSLVDSGIIRVSSLEVLPTIRERMLPEGSNALWLLDFNGTLVHK